MPSFKTWIYFTLFFGFVNHLTAQPPACVLIVIFVFNEMKLKICFKTFLVDMRVELGEILGAEFGHNPTVLMQLCDVQKDQYWPKCDKHAKSIAVSRFQFTVSAIKPSLKSLVFSMHSCEGDWTYECGSQWSLKCWFRFITPRYTLND